MGTMNKMRENTGVVLWILVFAFGVIWVLQDSGGLDALGVNTGADIIVVDGDPISYDEYSRALDAQIQQYQAQNDESMPPQLVDLTHERVFEALVEDRLREHEMERLGIEVTDDELYEMVMGDNPHPVIQMYFGDGQGNVNRELLLNYIENPEARQEWLQLEEYLRSERRRAKLENLISATVRVSEQDVLDEYQKRNRRADARYVALRYAALPDDSIQVTERDLRDFYDEHEEDFERKRTYTLDYVSMSKEPTAQDTSLIVGELERLRPRFGTTENDSLFITSNASERPYTSAFFRADELDPDLAAVVFEDPAEGKVIGPIVVGEEAHLIKITGLRPAEENAVQARHILVRAPEGNAQERAAARQKAQDLKARIAAGEDFAAVAREASDDPGSGARGSQLGMPRASRYWCRRCSLSMPGSDLGMRFLHVGVEHVQRVHVGLRRGDDDVGIGAETVDDAAAQLQAHGHLALGVGAAGDGVDRVQLETGAGLDHRLDRLEGGVDRT